MAPNSFHLILTIPYLQGPSYGTHHVLDSVQIAMGGRMGASGRFWTPGVTFSYSAYPHCTMVGRGISDLEVKSR